MIWETDGILWATGLKAIEGKADWIVASVSKAEIMSVLLTSVYST